MKYILLTLFKLKKKNITKMCFIHVYHNTMGVVNGLYTSLV